jgi:hypothetical protein
MLKGLSRLIVVLMVCLLTGFTPAMAAVGYTPYTKSAKLHYGQGVWYAPPQFTVYEKASVTSQPLAQITWGPGNEQTLTDTLQRKTIPVRQCMIAYYPAYQLGLLSVVGDAEPNWVEVVWDQATGKTGWVQTTSEPKPGFLPDAGTYQTWTEFMTTHAKPAGIHWFNGVPDAMRELHSQPDDYAKIVPAFYIQRLKVLHLKGNWMLLQGLDMERNSPIGWVRWREEDGQLLLFPNLDVPENPWRKRATVKTITP